MFNHRVRFINKALFREAYLKSKNLKIRTILDDDISSYHNDSILDDDEIYYEGNAIKVPSYEGSPHPKSIKLEAGLSNESLALIIDGIQQPEKNFAENEVPDEILEGEVDNSKRVFRQSDPSGSLVAFKRGRWVYPDGWDLAYYPAGKKGRRGKIERKRMWVRDTKLAGKSQLSLEDEYKRVFQLETVNGWSEKKEDSLVRSIAYLVARKIWYVGRKSSRETDEQWQDVYSSGEQ